MTTLVITDSIDVTADLVIPKLAPDVFRLNADLIRDYNLAWSPQGFSISDPTDRELRSEDVTAVYWRKPFMTSHYDHRNDPNGFFYAECRYAIRELYNTCKAAGARCLVEEGAERRLGKLMQLQIASRFFSVPPWKLTLGATPVNEGPLVAKSLSGRAVDTATCLYTTRVEPASLDPEHLWFTQREISKLADVTVVYVDGQVFASSCVSVPEIMDWRERIPSMNEADWSAYALAPPIVDATHAFMAACVLRFGRLDFALDEAGLHFLEVNPNGQWAWLDLDDRYGLISAVAAAASGLPRLTPPQLRSV